MTLILFSQSPTKHSRIGNSLLWMSRISYWLHQANLGFFFPWGYENYQSYFSNRSNWVAPNDKAYFLYASIFGEPLSAGALASRSRLIEDQYEKKTHWRRSHGIYSKYLITMAIFYTLLASLTFIRMK
jgi:hypothetical protein